MANGTLTERAAALHLNTEQALRLPAGALVPAPVRNLIREQAELLRDLAAEVEDLRAYVREGFGEDDSPRAMGWVGQDGRP